MTDPQEPGGEADDEFEDEEVEPPELGLGYICFDATQLIAFNNVGELDRLGEWFPHAFTPEVVTKREIGDHLKKYPQGQRILDASWLHSVQVRSPTGYRLYAKLHDELWQSAEHKDRGEAEVLALCKEYGWLAALDDDQARVAAASEDVGVRSVMMLTIIIAAAAHNLINPTRAWKLHCAVDEGRRTSSKETGRKSSFSYLSNNPSHRKPFMECVDKFRGIRERQGNKPWPHLLSNSRTLDGVIISVRNRP